MKKNEIEAFFEKNKEAFLEDLCALVRIDSSKSAEKPGMPYGEGCFQVLEAASTIGKRMGFRVRNFDNRVITLDAGPATPKLGILAHLDVVPAGDGWTYPPFAAQIVDGRMYGRGTADDKGACIAAMYAMKAAEEITGMTGLTAGCRLIMGADEECGSSDLAYYKQQEAMPPCVFSPDADFPVYNTEKGHFTPVFTADWDFGGAGPRVLAFHSRAAAGNVVPAGADAKLCGLTLESVQAAAEAFTGHSGIPIQVQTDENALLVRAEGVPAHASRPWEGKNASTALLAFLAQLPLQGRAAELLRALSQLFPFGDDFGKALGIAEKDELSGPLTVNLGILDVDEKCLRGGFDARTPLCTDQPAMIRKVKESLGARGLRLVSQECTAAHHTPESTEFVQTLLRAYAGFTGEKAFCASMGGCTYAHGIPGAVSFGPTFPNVETNLHSVDENVVLEDLFLAAKIFAQVILDVCGK